MLTKKCQKITEPEKRNQVTQSVVILNLKTFRLSFLESQM